MNTPRLDALMIDVIGELDLQGHGSRKRLAEALSIRPQQLNDWLSGNFMPSGEYTLLLLDWLEQAMEKKQPITNGKDAVFR